MERTRSAGWGLWFALASAATFGTSGPFAKALLVEGWSSGAIVLLRVGGASLVLLVPTLIALRGRWVLVRRNLGAILAYGGVAVAGCQVTYFYAVQRLSVGVALLLEYLGVILVVLYVWLRTRQAPARLTVAGIAVALVGLALVLDLAGQSRPDALGVFWGLLAALGLATYFVIAAHDSGLPPVALAGLGMAAGAIGLAIMGAVGILPMTFSSTPVVLMDTLVPWWVAIGELALIAAAAAYLLGVVAARALGSTVASFVGLTEVLFAVLWAWLLLGELPRPVQLGGGALIVVGVAAVRLGELRRDRQATAGPGSDEDPATADFPLPAGVA
jgi:drug/metabolite transporter (DMT)-like permease